MRDWKPLDMKDAYQRREKTPTDLVRILTTQLEDLKMHLGEHVRDTIFDNVDALAASLFGISESMVQQMKNEEETKEETN
uniref:Uncharacterized protein n=1 Tax=Caenorhabditis japonica TaxID=281687 RepID=A0A8R1EN57_CAEJA